MKAGASGGLWCPACRAPYRGGRECTRCGADLDPLLGLLERAWQVRRRSRELWLGGEHRRAARLAAGAQVLHATPAGRRLELLLRWCARYLRPTQ